MSLDTTTLTSNFLTYTVSLMEKTICCIGFHLEQIGVMYTKKGTTRYYDETNQRAIYDQEIVARFGIDPETTT